MPLETTSTKYIKGVVMADQKILKFIRKVVREEVRKIVKPLINEVLAEQFIRVLTEQKQTNTSLQSIVETKAPSPPVVNRSREKEQVRQKLLKKIAGDDPMQQLIYGDVEVTPGMGSLSNNSGYVDSDDEGVDLSKFGW